MSTSREHIRIFEHQTVRLRQEFADGVVFDREKLDAAVRFFGKGVPYFSLIHNGIKFNQYVGALQIGTTLISVLPKADQPQEAHAQKTDWNQILIDMLRLVHGFELKAPSSSELTIRSNSVLDLYFELFVIEVEYLLRRGLVKQYRKTEGNVKTLKGSLNFNKQLAKNLVRKERFYTQYTTYDTTHSLHIVLHQTLLVLKRINTNPALVSRISSLLLHFPELPQQKVAASFFEKLTYNRRTASYRKAMNIARLILLHYHPDLSRGRNDVLALMFDMNKLWEQFVLVSLRKNKELKVRGQNSKFFWKPHDGKRRTIRPDITIAVGGENYVLDTKWKLVERKPGIEDIKQMYAYHHYFAAKKVALLYPGNKPYRMGQFVEIEQQQKLSGLECGLLFSRCTDSVRQWQEQIGSEVQDWIAKG